jgi:hypothetical protein
MARDLFADQDLNWGDRARLGLQGASFNLSDEALAKFQSLFPGRGTYEENVAEQRRKIESARSKPGSFKYELGGAMVPALLAAPFTGGASVPLTAARLGTLGGTQALTAGLGAREGSLEERFTESPLTLAAETGAGALLGATAPAAIPLIKSAVSSAVTPVKAMVRALTGQPPKIVEAEVRRIAASIYPELSPIEGARRIVKEIEAGAILPDLSRQAAIDTRAIVSSAGRGGAAIEETIEARGKRLPQEARESLQTDLVPENPQGNIVRAMNETTDELKAAESAAYNRIFADVDLPPSGALNSAALDLAKISKSKIRKLEELLAEEKLRPLFKINDEGVYELTRNVSLKDAEILRRGLQDSVDSAIRAGDNNLARARKNTELGLREIIDDLSPDLKTTRANWSQISKVKKTFDDSRKIFGKTAEDAEIYIEDIIADGNTEIIAAMRAGAASGLKAKTSATSPNAVLRNLNNADRKERMILEKLYPGDSAEEIFKKINRAAKATETKNIVLHGSQTAPTTGAQARIGTGAAEMVSDAVNVATTGNFLQPIVRFASNVLSRDGKKLTQEQLEQVARIIITEDPNIMQKALSDPIIQEALIRKIQQTGNLLQRSVAGASGYGAGEGTRRLFDDPNR